MKYILLIVLIYGVGIAYGVAISPSTSSTSSTSSTKAPKSTKPEVSTTSKSIARTAGVSKAEEQKAQKKILKLRNVKLVVEDYEDKSFESLVPVEPVALRQKPKVASIIEVKRESLSLPQLKVTYGDKLDADGNVVGQGSGDGGDNHNPILVVSKVEDEESPVLDRGNASGVTYSPFHPPPPGTFPSTLSQRETVSVGSYGSEIVPLPPISNAGGLSNLDPNLPSVRVARALAVDPRLNTQVGNPFSGPTSSAEPSGNSYYTDSESSALLHMATESTGFEGPSSSIFGKMW